ncbi:MAG: hypothetical protein IJ853_00885 [Rickettsiales bacterium]|nr:hypothetical protein [Rickettsiales bacterium]
MKNINIKDFLLKLRKKRIKQNGGAGSGNWRHKGRPGKVGGSGKGGNNKDRVIHGIIIGNTAKTILKYKEVLKNKSTIKNIVNKKIKDIIKTTNRGLKYDREEDRGYDFRRIQEASRNLSREELDSFHAGKKGIDGDLYRRLSNVLSREVEAKCGSNGNGNELLKNTGDFKIYKDVDSSLFKDCFEIARSYLKHGELVDLHDDYKDCKCYLADNGLSGFAIEPDGNLVSVFNIAKKRGFLRAISETIKQNVTHLDCYNSEQQPLAEMYRDKLGFKTASIMDYNMEYDHDDIAKNHNMPQVAFMVNTDKDVKTKHFNKDQYDEAVNYQKSIIKKK